MDRLERGNNRGMQVIVIVDSRFEEGGRRKEGDAMKYN